MFIQAMPFPHNGPTSEPNKYKSTRTSPTTDRNCLGTLLHSIVLMPSQMHLRRQAIFRDFSNISFHFSIILLWFYSILLLFYWIFTSIVLRFCSIFPLFLLNFSIILFHFSLVYPIFRSFCSIFLWFYYYFFPWFYSFSI